jgi:hypothetical protein
MSFQLTIIHEYSRGIDKHQSSFVKLDKFLQRASHFIIKLIRMALFLSFWFVSMEKIPFLIPSGEGENTIAS